MLDLEKNDVDISKLFGWKGSVDIKDLNEEVVIKAYIRLVGDADINRARIMALRESAKLRKELNTENSDARVALIMPLEYYTREELLTAIVSLDSREITQQAAKDSYMPIPVEPNDDATLEDQEIYQKEIEDFPTKKLAKINEMVSKDIQKRMQAYENQDLESIRANYVTKSVNILCDSRSMDAFRDACVYFGTFRDSEYKRRLFNSFDEFDNLPTQVKNQFRDFYMELEMGSDDLKK